MSVIEWSGTLNTDHSNLNIVCITSALHPIYMYTMLSRNFFIIIFCFLYYYYIYTFCLFIFKLVNH